VYETEKVTRLYKSNNPVTSGFDEKGHPGCFTQSLSFPVFPAGLSFKVVTCSNKAF
jgi:hypothetical protein